MYLDDKNVYSDLMFCLHNVHCSSLAVNSNVSTMVLWIAVLLYCISVKLKPGEITPKHAVIINHILTKQFHEMVVFCFVTLVEIMPGNFLQTLFIIICK